MNTRTRRELEKFVTEVGRFAVIVASFPSSEVTQATQNLLDRCEELKDALASDETITEVK